MLETLLGRSCKRHVTCASVLHIDALVRIKWTQIDYGKSIFMLLFCQITHSPINFRLADVNKRRIKAGVYWVNGGMDWCLVGFLPDKYLAQKDALNGRLGQVDEFYEPDQKALF